MKNNMRASIVLTFLLLIVQTVCGEIIPQSRRLTWEGNVGVAGGIPDSSKMTVFTTLSPGSSAGVVNTAIRSCPSNQVVKLAAGNYTWTDDLELGKDGVVLKGSGMNS